MPDFLRPHTKNKNCEFSLIYKIYTILPTNLHESSNRKTTKFQQRKYSPLLICGKATEDTSENGDTSNLLEV